MKPLGKQRRSIKNAKVLAQQLDRASRWWTGGTLSNSTLKEWHADTFDNGLATCADWVTTLEKMKNKTQSFDIRQGPDDPEPGKIHPEKFLGACLQLLNAITNSSKNQPKAWYMRTAELALVSAYALGWLDDRQSESAKPDIPQELQASLAQTIQEE